MACCILLRARCTGTVEHGKGEGYFTWFVKNETYNPTNIGDDAIEESVSKASQPGGLWSIFRIYLATEANVQDNKEAAKIKLKLPVLAVGSKDFIGKEVENQMKQAAGHVQYSKLNFGRQLVEECPDQLTELNLKFLQNLKSQ